jgi:N-methylhydantoinase A/oxoprolinase/acetone carboxylase beta subunit
VTSEIPVCQVLLISNEPELGLEIVSSLCQEVARELTGSELRFAQDALPKAKATLEEAAKKQAKLEPRRKELEEKYKFNVRGVGDKDDVYVGDAEFTGPLRDKLAKLQELQFGNDLRSASVQAQLDYVRTALAKERQDLRLGSGGPSEPFIAINPAWTSLKQRLVELETESIGLKATGDRLKQVLTETQGALNDATEYLTLEKTLRQATTEASQAKAEYESLQTIVTRIESAGPLPLPYVVRSWLPIPDRPGLIRQPVVKPVPAPNP